VTHRKRWLERCRTRHIAGTRRCDCRLVLLRGYKIVSNRNKMICVCEQAMLDYRRLLLRRRHSVRAALVRPAGCQCCVKCGLADIIT